MSFREKNYDFISGFMGPQGYFTNIKLILESRHKNENRSTTPIQDLTAQNVL